MPREFNRKDRVGDALQRELSQLIRDELRDPRVGLVTITAAEVNRDLSTAKIYVTFVDLDSDEERQLATNVLNGAAGFLRSQLARVMKMRVTPRLRFICDDSGKQGSYLSALIDRAISADEQRHQHAIPADSETTDTDTPENGK
ncbi:MAG: 30S ribosome-binding factor RbfA [Porticoccaceae bacterium]|nr:30S ribosome-binding factor RbfA [Pseudomonadales bacterium]MCP5170927.1 30S ribosome-binding factor RbfA [Pseudomonadales bacterium]MCP5301833.1 30S ribosome-binding factor RbfA [Pseudomonadales bacterium]